MYFEPENKSKTVVTFGGKVVPVDRDNDGKVMSVCICASDEREYSVKDTLLGQELKRLVGTAVEVTGVLEESKESKPTITVHDYYLSRSY